MVHSVPNSGGGTRHDLSNKGEDPTKWVGWPCDYSDSLASSHLSQSWNDDGLRSCRAISRLYRPPCTLYRASEAIPLREPLEDPLELRFLVFVCRRTDTSRS